MPIGWWIYRADARAEHMQQQVHHPLGILSLQPPDVAVPLLLTITTRLAWDTIFRAEEEVEVEA